jgi:KDO2-lipid IV(A) lauroyltransferase
MKALYTIFYSVFWLLSLLPLPVLYVLSDALYPIVYYVVRYRRKIVHKQLSESFPQKTEEEIISIERKFYHFFCDYIVETLKLISISEEEMRKRVQFDHLEALQEEMLEKGKTFGFAYLGHFGNWEWLASFALWTKEDISAAQIYHPLRNKQFDRFFLQLRAQFGGESIPMKETLRRILTLRKQEQKTIVAFIADQSPKWEAMHHWTRFLNHDTSFFIGAEKMGKPIDAMFFYVHVTRPKRGYYHCCVEAITWDPKTMDDYQITDLYAQMLEKQIQEHPELWLWTHNRWKRTKEKWLQRKAEEQKQHRNKA